jgi:predicted Rossmann fold nucleotide-binding protein DprA/Smf involved in DNA uptake
MYPERWVQALGKNAPARFCWLGETRLMTIRALGLVCSVRCPGEVIVKTHELAEALRDAAIPVIGGFHSPMEKECLSSLLEGRQPVLLCLGRSLEGMRLPEPWRRPVEQGRLLIVSGFDKRHDRLTARTAMLRNRHVVALADQVLVSHASRGSQTERLCEYACRLGRPLWTVASDYNEHLLTMGARAVDAGRVSSFGALSMAPAEAGPGTDDQLRLPLDSLG